MTSEINKLILKFEENIEQTQKMTNAILKFEDALKNLNILLEKLYKDDKLKDLERVSNQLLNNMESISFNYKNINNKQEEISNEFLKLRNRSEDILNKEDYNNLINSKILEMDSKISLILENLVNEKQHGINSNTAEEFFNNEKYAKIALETCISDRYKIEEFFKYKRYKLGEKTSSYVNSIYNEMKQNNDMAIDILTIIKEYMNENLDNDLLSDDYYKWIKKVLG